MTHTSTEQPEALPQGIELAKLLSKGHYSMHEATDEIVRQHARILELEAAQAQRAPLTEDQVRKNKTIRLMNASSGLSIGMLMGLVRAIERAQDEARGITQEKQG